MSGARRSLAKCAPKNVPVNVGNTGAVLSLESMLNLRHVVGGSSKCEHRSRFLELNNYFEFIFVLFCCLVLVRLFGIGRESIPRRDQALFS